MTGFGRGLHDALLVITYLAAWLLVAGPVVLAVLGGLDTYRRLLRRRRLRDRSRQLRDSTTKSGRYVAKRNPDRLL